MDGEGAVWPPQRGSTDGHHRSIDYLVVCLHPLDSWATASSSSSSPPSMRGGTAVVQASAAEQQHVQGHQQRSSGRAYAVAAKWRMVFSSSSIGVGALSFFSRPEMLWAYGKG
jgi:hypothetical protein